MPHPFCVFPTECSQSARGTEIAYSTGMHGQHQTLPQAGDVLISKPTAIAEHDVSIVAVSTSVLRARYELAITEGRKLAEELKVDLWLTQDHTHFLQLAGHRGRHRQQ